MPVSQTQINTRPWLKSFWNYDSPYKKKTFNPGLGLNWVFENSPYYLKDPLFLSICRQVA